MPRPIISLLTDFGSADHYVGTMKGVILGICPEAQLVDISHEIRPFAIAEAAWSLAQAWPFFPKGTVHLVVIDPGVGSTRRPILVEVDGHYFVAPDNGVLTMVLDADARHRVREISAAEYFLEPMSRTFHGRDVFAPVAAHLASGVDPSRFGEGIDDYVRTNYSEPFQEGPGEWTGVVLRVDRFGNIISNFRAEIGSQLNGRAFEMRVGTGNISRLASSYAEESDGQAFVITGSSGYLEISMNQGDAATESSVKAGAPIHLRLLQ